MSYVTLSTICLMFVMFFMICVISKNMAIFLIPQILFLILQIVFSYLGHKALS